MELLSKSNNYAFINLILILYNCIENESCVRALINDTSNDLEQETMTAFQQIFKFY